ncbi:hypothetical protein CVV65_03330 [Kyrpidia spormannii]|uniref:Uncharacterized protein n=1 Tax=Kyrpidia spormannii TaxID=2055160 RepID=A0A2K8N3R3_9BACL|nr:hypothetical protein CVV65_03330 [Kyrpidia spormannii]
MRRRGGKVNVLIRVGLPDTPGKLATRVRSREGQRQPKTLDRDCPREKVVKPRGTVESRALLRHKAELHLAENKVTA